jgi:hypothetical protein
MNDEAALSTRPDYPLSPKKFDHKAAEAKAAAKLATLRVGTSTRKNAVRIFTIQWHFLLNVIIVVCRSPFRRQ